MSAWANTQNTQKYSNTQILSSTAQSKREIDELATICYQYKLTKQDLFLAEQINKRNMKKEVQYLLDHKLSVYELECAYRAKGYLG